MNTILRRSLLFAACAAAMALPAFGDNRTQPSVLFVIVDDLRPLISCQGDPIAKTPNLDRLAAEGMVFERAYAQYPICGPSRASFMSGMRPETTGHMTNHAAVANTMPDVLMVNRYFKESGYTTIGAGKVFHYGSGPTTGWSLPFTNSDWLDHVKPESKAKAAKFFKPDSEGLPPSSEGEEVPDSGYCDGKATGAALAQWEGVVAAGKPFFMAVGMRKPHLPWCAPKKHWDFYDRERMPIAENRYYPKGAPKIALKQFGELFGYSDIPKEMPLPEDLYRKCMHAYYACVSYADAQLGRLMNALREAGVYDNTIIVLCGDNGYHHGNNGVWTKGVCWESTCHVPLLLKVPGAKKGQRSKALIELVDIYPTLCEAAGLKVPAHCEGKSLLPLVLDPRGDWDDVAFSQFRKGQAIARSIRTDRYRFTLWEKGKSNVSGIELYDYMDDPQGNMNLAASPENQGLVMKLTKLHRQQWPNEY